MSTSTHDRGGAPAETDSPVAANVHQGARTHTQVTDEATSRRVEWGLWALEAWRATRSWATRAWRAVSSVTTGAGWAVFLWTACGFAVGLTWGWGEFLIGATVGLVLLLIALPSLIGREPYEVDFQLTHDSVVAGQEATAHIVVKVPQARIALPGRVDLPVGEGLVDFYVPMLRQQQEHTEPIVIPAARRGIIAVGPATTTRADPLHLLQRTFHWADVQTLYVHPVTVAVPSTSQGFIRDLEGRSTRTLANEDISFHAVREYARGDALRQVHWKSTAKTGQLMVRQFEETRRSTLAIVLDLDVTSYEDELEFEMAVSAAGSLGVRAIRDGRDVHVVVSGEVPEFARASVRTLEQLAVTTPRRLLDELAGVESSAAVAAMPALTRMLVEVSQGTSLAFLVTGSRASLTDLASAALAFPPDVAVAAVVCNPRSEPGMHAMGRMRLLTLGILDDLRQLLARGAS